jgi:hypothetical protein
MSTHACEISDPDLDRHAGAALVAAGQVIAKPSDQPREGRVYGTRGYEYASVHNVRVRASYAPDYY